MQTMRDSLSKVFDEALAGSHKLKVIFKHGREGFDVIYYLAGMVESKLVKLPPDQEIAYIGIRTATIEGWRDYWNDISNRTTTIELTELFLNNYKNYKF